MSKRDKNFQTNINYKITKVVAKKLRLIPSQQSSPPTKTTERQLNLWQSILQIGANCSSKIIKNHMFAKKINFTELTKY